MRKMNGIKVHFVEQDIARRMLPQRIFFCLKEEFISLVKNGVKLSQAVGLNNRH